MREIVVISGKGGTGKTSITAAFAHLAQGALLCDLDVDAPDLHLLLDPRCEEEHEFRSGELASIDPEACTACGLCAELCRFEAVVENGGAFAIDPGRCEGCAVCAQFCLAGAVTLRERLCGWWRASAMRFGPMVHAQLYPGQENSGRLVALLKKEARARAQAAGLQLILCDGAPGIGCPVISSLSGADLAVVVTEPTPSGRHDLERVLGLCDHFRIPTAVIINKYDVNLEHSAGISRSCADAGRPVLGLLPFDEVVVRSMNLGKCATELPPTPFSTALAAAWEALAALPARRTILSTIKAK